MNDEKVYAVLSSKGHLFGPMSLRCANREADPEYPDGLEDENAIIVRLTPVDCMNSTLEDEFREQGVWPPGKESK